MSTISIDKLSYQSPNYSVRKAGIINSIVIHYTDMQSAESALEHLCNPESEVSAHYLITRTGQVYQLVADNLCAWHAGASFWMGQRNLNDVSLGIELENKGHSHGMEEYTDAQIHTLCELIYQLRLDYSIYPNNIIGHSDIAPGRKIDPGPLFDWRLLAAKGFCIWPRASQNVHHSDPEELLHRIGYDPEASLSDKIIAFQYHYTPQNITGEVSEECFKIMNGLLDLYTLLYAD